MKNSKRKIKLNMSKKKVFVIISILVIILSIVISVLKINNKQINTISPELAKAKTYSQVEEGEEATNSEYVNFDAFFLRDLDEDGYAESIRGTCREVGKEDTLYMELNVLTNGRLENGVITINSDNFYLQTALPKDSEIKNNVIGSNIKRIELNTINNGTQKLLTGIVRTGDYSYESKKTDAIGNDTTRYSRVNSITLTGTHVADDGTRTEISKTVDFNVDWYGEVSTSIVSYMGNFDYKNQEKDISNIVDEENKEIKLNFSIRTRENNNQLILKKAYIEGTIPQLNGYDPISVAVTGTNVTYTYDEETRVFTAQRDAILNEDNIVTNVANDYYNTTRYNEYNLEVKYPLEAYKLLGSDTVEIKIPIKAYYEGFNNSNEEFENPIKSNVVEDVITVSFRKPEGEAAIFDIYVGKYSSKPSYRYWISKEKPLKIYNQISAEEVNDEYLVQWIGSTGSEGESSGMIMKETADGAEKVTDKFIKSNAEEISIDDLTENVAIYFDNPVNLLGENGWIKVYDDETDALIATFDKSNWRKYSRVTPYWYELPIKHIRIETSATNKLSSLYVYNIKELDDSYITENYTREEFDNLRYIKSTLSGYLGGSYVNTDTHQAYYEAPLSDLSAYISNSTMSTQETLKNAEITLTTNCIEEYNEVKWKNGEFLLKMPREIIDLKINSVTIDNEKVEIVSYEKYEKNGELYIKILTSNYNPESYEIKLNLDITPDPRIVTTNKSIEVYSSNENSVDYSNPQADIYDVNSNLNIQENVQKNNININLISPNSLLTNQTATDYDDNGSMTVAPQIGIVEIDQKTATLNISLTNNYNSTISDVKVLGRVPFEGNKYVIANGDMGSTYSTVMTNTGLSVPDEIKDYVKVYYTEVENATKDLNNEENGWTETPSDFSKVKCYLIDFENYVLKTGEMQTFSYTINIVDSVDYNDISYSDYAIYFSIDTENGKYKTQTEPNKLGLMIAKTYDLQITKNKLGKDKLVPGATYCLETSNAVGGEGTRTATTNLNGILEFEDLYVKKEYTLREIKSPDNYVLNDDIIKFTTDIDNNGNLAFQLIEGEFKDTPNVVNDGSFQVQAKLEDDIKYDFSINKVDVEGKPAKGITFKLSSDKIQKVIKTGLNGKVKFNELTPGVEYTLEEVSAEGYYRVFDTIKFIVTRKNGVLEFETDSEILKNSLITETEERDKAQVSVQITNEKIPTYNFELLKIEKDDETQKGLSKARYELTSLDTGNVSYYTTDENGKINVDNLYQYVDGKYLTGEYSLKEIVPPNGYVTSKDVIRFRVFKNESNELQFEILNEDETTSIRNRKIEGTTFKLVLEDRPQFTLTKLDSETNEVLAGAKFAIYKVDKNKIVLGFAKDVYGNYIGEYEDGYYLVTTDEKGQIKLALPGGYYKSVEIVSPEGYKLPAYEGSRTEYFTIEGAEDETTYEISKIEDLVAFSNSVNAGDTYEGKTVTLLNLLDFNSEESYVNPLDKRFGDLNGDGITKGVMEELTDINGKGFTPIGKSSTYSFKGIFEGNGNEIKNIYIKSDKQYVGLFGYADTGSIIQNLSIAGNINSTNYYAYLGGVTGYTTGTINNCINNSGITYNVDKNNTTYIGGITGYSKNIILNSCNNGIISSETSRDSIYVGGIAGYSNKILNSYNTANIVISGKNVNIGGVTASCNKIVVNVYNTGNLIGNATEKLSIAGITNSNSIIKSTYNKGNISGTGVTINTGYISSYSGTLSNMNNSYYLADITLIDGGTQNIEGISKTSDEMKPQYFVNLLNTYYDSWGMDINNINGGYPILDTTKNIDNFKVTEINYVEDLVQLSKIVNDGLFLYENETLELKRTLDFNNDNSYIDPNDMSSGDLNEDGVIEGIKAELTKENGIGFTPIGINYDNYFKGIFEGNGNELQNIYINSEEYLVGLFGYTYGGKINNVGISGNIISNYNGSGRAYIGGIIGDMQNSIIKRCYNKANIAYKGTSYVYIGGIAGYTDRCIINNNFNIGNIIDEVSQNSDSYAGGIIGSIDDSKIVGNYNNGNIVGSGNVGAISGEVSIGILKNNYYLNTITIMGNERISSNVQSKTQEEMKSDGFVELLNSEGVIWQKDINLINNGYPLPYRELIETEYITEINFIEDLVKISKQVNSGYSYKEKTIILNTTLDFESDEAYLNPNDTSYGDINGNGIVEGIKQELTNKSYSGFIPIGSEKNPFEGNFDGNGYEIQNIYIKSSNRYVGLFGIVTGDIRNLSIYGNITQYNNYTINFGEIAVGGIVGKSNGNIFNCINNSIIKIDNYNLRNLTVYIGGIVGINDKEIIQCYNNSKIICTKMCEGIYYYIGGIAGRSNILSYCYNIGQFEIIKCDLSTAPREKIYIGGITGYASKVSRSYNKQNINNELNFKKNYSWGGSGIYSKYIYTGGVVGYCDNIESCYNIGDVMTNYTVESLNINGGMNTYIYTGGIVGYGNNLRNCYFVGNVTSGYSINSIKENLEIQSSTNSGELLGNKDVSSIDNYYNDLNVITSEDFTYESGTSKTETEMKSEDFVNLLNTGAGNEDTWKYVEGNYPTLNMEYKPSQPSEDVEIVLPTEIDIKNDVLKYRITTDVIPSETSNGNSIEMNSTEEEQYKWNKNEDGVYSSGNYNISNSTSTIKSNEFELTKESLLLFDWTVSSESANYDYLYYTITNTETNEVIDGKSDKIGGTSYGTEYNKLKWKNKIVDLQPGKYILEFIYIKDVEVDKGLDTAYVKNIMIREKGGNITGEDESPYEVVVYNNNSIKPIEIVPEDGFIIECITINGEKIAYEANADRKYTLPQFENMTENKHIEVKFSSTIGQVVEKHLLAVKNEDGTYTFTDTELSGATTTTGQDGENYSTSPKIDLENYELISQIVDDEKEYIIPDGSNNPYESAAASGKYEAQMKKNVIYYYVEKEIPLTVHHYIEGTTEPVELNDGTKAEDITNIGIKGTQYSTSALDSIAEMYELVSIPSNANGIYEVPEVVVTYYYKIKKINITTEVKKHTETDSLGVTKEVAGGTISGESESIYEKVIYADDSVKEITAVPDEGYEVKSIIVNGEQIEFTPNEDKTVTLNKFINMTEDKNVVVEFRKIQGTLTVHHYIEGTTTQISLKDGTLVEDENKTGNVGDMYVTKPIENISDMYEVVKVPENSSGNYIDGNIEVIYYYRLKEYNYVVNYLEKNTNEVLHDPKQEISIYGTEIISSNEVIEIDGYNYNSVDKDKLTISYDEEANIINIYYTKRGDLSYTVNYLEKDTNKELHEPKVAENITFGDVIISSNEVIDIYGYNYDSVDKENITIKTNAEENVINIFYTKKDTSIVVHYYIEGTTNKVPTQDGSLVEDVTIEGKVFDEYETEEAENVSEKYELIQVPDNSTGTMAEDVIEVIYYYRLKDTSLIVKYLEKGSNKELATQDSKTGKVDDEYTTTAKEIENYELVEDSGNTEGKLTVEPITVIYYYLQKTKVIVNHIDKNKLGDSDELPEEAILAKEEELGLVGDTYTSSAKDFEEYVLVEKPEQETVTMTKDVIILNYYYVHVSAGVVEKHIDINSNKVLDNKVYEGNEGETYTTSSKEFEGYDIATNLQYYNYNYDALLEEYDEKTIEEVLNNPANDTMEKILVALKIDPKAAYIPKNATGTMTIDPIEVKYYYIRPASVRVEYIDKITGEKIPEKNTEEDGKITEKDSTVKIHGHEGDFYKAIEKEFEEYDIIKEEYPENAEGEMKVIVKEDGTVESETVVKYYYVKKSAGVVERHYDEKTGKLLEKETKYEGHEGDSYSTKVKEFEGYDVVEEKLPTNAEGTMTVEQIVVNYYYIRKAQVIERHYDIKTGELLEEETKYEGHEGDSYKTKEKVFNGYELVKEKYPDNAEGIMQVRKKADGTISTETIVNYYYIRKAQVIERHIDEETGKLLEEATVYEGYEGDEYKTSSKEFKGYEVNKEKLPENAEGTMRVKVKEEGSVNTTIIVNYYYKKIKDTEKPNEIPKDDESGNNPIKTIINNIYNTITNNTDGTPGEKTPNTGDLTPIITMSAIALIILLNVIQLKVEKQVKYSRIQKSVINSKTSNGRKALRGKRFKE